MKNLLVLIATVAFATNIYAQAPAEKKSSAKMTHCYAMKDGAMVQCWGKDGHEAMTEDVTLKNGTMVSTTGEVTMKDGKKVTLANGQCILANGKIGDFDKLHAMKKGMEKKDDKKM